MSHLPPLDKMSWFKGLYHRTHESLSKLNGFHGGGPASDQFVPTISADHQPDHQDVARGEHDTEKNHFLRQVVSMILDEYGLIGQADAVKSRNEKLINFSQPAELEKILDLKISDEGLNNQQLIDFCHKVVNYSVKTTHPHFYNQLYGGVDQFGIAGSWLSDALNTSQATYEISPVFTIIERKIIEYCGLKCGWNKDQIDGIFAPGGSMSNMYGLILARYSMFPDSKKNGIRDLPPLVAFGSDNAHYSLSKSAIWMGLGTDAIVKVKTDDRGKMVPSELEKCIEQAKLEGKIPFSVTCTAGTTVLGAFDPIRDIASICKKHGLWLHVDAALGGTFLLSDKHRNLLDGIDQADSMAWNLHKLAGVPLQCSLFLTRRPNLLRQCNSLHAEYIFQNDKYYDADYDSGDKSIQCGRKVDSLKAWLVLAAHGEREWQHLVDNLVQMNRYITDKIRHRPNFKLVLPQFEGSTVSFWYIPDCLRDGSSSPASIENIDPARLHKVCPLIKSQMMSTGKLMINYQPLTCKNLPNFFRLSLTCIPPATMEDMDFIVDEIERLGKNIQV